MGVHALHFHQTWARWPFPTISLQPSLSCLGVLALLFSFSLRSAGWAESFSKQKISFPDAQTSGHSFSFPHLCFSLLSAGWSHISLLTWDFPLPGAPDLRTSWSFFLLVPNRHFSFDSASARICLPQLGIPVLFLQLIHSASLLLFHFGDI